MSDIETIAAVAKVVAWLVALIDVAGIGKKTWAAAYWTGLSRKQYDG